VKTCKNKEIETVLRIRKKNYDADPDPSFPLMRIWIRPSSNRNIGNTISQSFAELPIFWGWGCTR